MGSSGGIEDRLRVLLTFFSLSSWWFTSFDCWKWWDRKLERCKTLCSDCWTTAWC